MATSFRFHPTLLALVLSMTLAQGAMSAESEAKLHVYPPDVQLSDAGDRQSIVVQLELPSGLTQDVTEQAQFNLEQPVARLDGNVLFPAADGTSKLTVRYGEMTAEVPVQVVDHAKQLPISFQLDVMPVFMKAGCNTGSCHGAARGKDGFRLSLFGFDPQGDHHRLTREVSGRRINLALPAESLLIEKATGKVPHTGGTRFHADSPLCATLLKWLESGAPYDPGEVPTVVAVELYPPAAVLDGEGTTQRLTVRARYSDGTDRDVTGLAYFMTNNDNSASVSQEAAVTAANRGEAFLMARFETHTVGAHFIVLPKGLEFQPAEIAENNYIDRWMHEKFRKLRIVPSELCSDEEFLRRVTLDITGLLPTKDEYDRFMGSTDPKKRELLVDELLERKEFVELWVMKWAELLQIRSSQTVSYKSMLLYFNWLREQIARDVPTDQMVRQLLASTGGTFANPATNYYQNETDTLKVAENVAQVFLGMRIQCAQCHNHPFDRWTMNDYYSFAAFFSQIGRKPAEDPREIIVFNSGGGEIQHPVGGRVMPPKFLGDEVPDVAGKDRREVLAGWLASDNNPYFAPNLANIVWSHFFGRGIIDPVDDVRVSNPAANPELLQDLARHISEYRYDFKKLVRDICTSRTYQLSTRTNPSNESDTSNFSHAQLRRLRAEVLLDAISQVTETRNKFQGLPLGARAVQIADGNTSTYFLTAFGRASRETACSCEVVMEPNLSQALHLLNGESVHQKILEGKLVETRLAEGKTPMDVVDELYIRCLTRRPTQQERETLGEVLAAEQDPKPVLEDIFWSLLNSREFLFNH